MIFPANYTPPIQCSWTEVPECIAKRKECVPNGTVNEFACLRTAVGLGPWTTKHSIKTNYTVSVGGVLVPIQKTDRTWSSSYTYRYSVPKNGLKISYHTGGISWLPCGGITDQELKSEANEDCTIIKSTLHYLDLRYNVCLYKKNTETFKFNLVEDSVFQFRNPYGQFTFLGITLKDGNEKNYSNACKEEWILIKDGAEQIIATTNYESVGDLRQFASGQGDLFNPSYQGTNANTALILLIPGPSDPQYTPWDDKLRYYGWYDYRRGYSPHLEADGGCPDFYYPAWVRAMQSDPLWKRAAERRVTREQTFIVTSAGQVVPNPSAQPVTNNEWVAPTVTVDPIPHGTYVKHPEVGEVYQWLINKRNGTTHLETSPNLDKIIKDNLIQEFQESTEPILYYPIGVM